MMAEQKIEMLTKMGKNLEQLGLQERKRSKIYSLSLQNIFTISKLQTKKSLRKEIGLIQTLWFIQVINPLQYKFTISFCQKGQFLNFGHTYPIMQLKKICFFINNITHLEKGKISQQNGFLKITYHVIQSKTINSFIKNKVMYLVASFFNVLLQLSKASGKDVDGKQETKLYENREKENSIFKNVEIQPYNDESLQVKSGKSKNIKILRNVQLVNQKVTQWKVNAKNKISRVKITAQQVDTLNKKLDGHSQNIQKQMILKEKDRENQQFGADFQAESLKKIRNLQIQSPNLGEYFIEIAEDLDDDSEEQFPQYKVKEWVFCKYYYGKELDRYFDNDKLSQKISFTQKVYIFYQICSALFSLKKHKLIHYDLKQKNIIVLINNTIRIIDFGCCCFRQSKQVLENKKTKDLLQQNILLQGMKLRMTQGYYDPQIRFQDIYHENFDLYGLAKIIQRQNTKIKILETMKNQELFYFKNFTQITQQCFKRPSQNQLSIEKILKFFQEVLKEVKLRDQIAQIIKNQRFKK